MVSTLFDQKMPHEAKKAQPNSRFPDALLATWLQPDRLFIICAMLSPVSFDFKVQ